jgi:hypothetical protein
VWPVPTDVRLGRHHVGNEAGSPTPMARDTTPRPAEDADNSDDHEEHGDQFATVLLGTFQGPPAFI